MRKHVSVQIKYLSALRDLTGRRSDTVSLHQGAMLRDAVDWLNERYALSLPNSRTMMVLNGRGWQQLPAGLHTPLGDGDVLSLFPPISGG